MEKHHKPVLLQKVLQFMEGRKFRTFLDATLGSGGHSREILVNHGEIEFLIGIDRDLLAIEIAKENLRDFNSKVRIFHGNFANTDEIISTAGISEKFFDGILFDVGVSSMQLDSFSRGFSFRENVFLDMRMDTSRGKTAAYVVNNWSEKELGRIFRDYGEEIRWRQAARAIVDARRKKSITTTGELSSALRGVTFRRRKIHPLTLVFQALRIEVNDELNNLKKGLIKAIGMLANGGILMVITFHRLEERVVKSVFKAVSRAKYCDVSMEIITKKPISASEEEINNNRRSRSAKLRIAELKMCDRSKFECNREKLAKVVDDFYGDAF